MRVVVTGAAGFIGSHTVEALLDKGHQVIGVDDLSTGRLCNLEHLDTDQFSLIQGDIRDLSICSLALAGADAVVHLAARNSVPRSVSEPDAAVEVNVMGGTRLLIAAHQAQTKRFVYASSSSVYGHSQRLPQAESDPTQPLSPYAASKSAFEQIAMAWQATYNLPCVGLRFFNVFGPRQDPNSSYAAVIPTFLTGLKNNSPIHIDGDGNQSRDFTYVDDAVAGIVCALESDQTGVFNIACGGRTTINQLWSQLCQLSGVNAPQPEHTNARVGDMRATMANIERSTALLGYRPQVGFEEGLRRTLASYLG